MEGLPKRAKRVGRARAKPVPGVGALQERLRSLESSLTGLAGKVDLDQVKASMEARINEALSRVGAAAAAVAPDVSAKLGELEGKVAELSPRSELEALRDSVKKLEGRVQETTRRAKAVERLKDLEARVTDAATKADLEVLRVKVAELEEKLRELSAKLTPTG